MSFTEDELQAFNTILERRLQAQQRDMERALDQRMIGYRRELDHHLEAVHVEVQRGVSRKLSEYQARFETIVSEKLDLKQSQIMKAFHRDIEKKQQQFEGTIDQMLAAQLLGIEQIISQYSVQHDLEAEIRTNNIPEQFGTIEVQTDLAWEDLMDIIGKILDVRLSAVNDTIQKSLKNLESYLFVQIQSLRAELVHVKADENYGLLDGDMTGIQEVLRSIEQLEQVMESMQVLMASNHALLTHRLHQQQLTNGINQPFTASGEHMLNGIETENILGLTQKDE